MCYFPKVLSLELPNLHNQVNFIGSWQCFEEKEYDVQKKRPITGIFNITFLIKLSILLDLAVSAATVLKQVNQIQKLSQRI